MTQSTRLQSRSFRLIMFGLIYFVQGSVLAYFRNFQKPYLDSFGIDADVIGLLTSILLLPFILKIFIGMLSDRVNLFGAGYRKPYILLGLALAVFAFGAAAFVLPDRSFALFSILVVTGSFSVALFDSTSDGLAIDSTPREEQGTVQSVMVGGRAVGFIVLSLAFGWLVTSTGYRVVFLIMAGSMLLPLILVSQVRETAERNIDQQFNRAAFRVLGKPYFLIFAAYAIVYSIASFGVDGLVTFHMSQTYDAPETLIGTYGALRGAGAVLGALGAGLLINRIGRKQIAYGAVILISIGAVLLGFAPGVSVLVWLGVAWGIAWGFQETVFVALAMDIVDSRIAASMFALMMALSNIGTALGEGVATGLTDNLSFGTIFLILAGINLAVFPILWGLFKVAPEMIRK